MSVFQIKTVNIDYNLNMKFCYSYDKIQVVDTIIPIPDLLLHKKPGRYAGLCRNFPSFPEKYPFSIAIVYPDIYEIGFSNLSLRILINLFAKYGAFVDIAFLPDTDLIHTLKIRNIPLKSFKSLKPLKDFDVIAITLQSELLYSNILNFFDISHIPFESSKRKTNNNYPLILGGGPCTINPFPVLEFFDCFYIGEIEEKFEEIFNALSLKNKKNRVEALSEIGGIVSAKKTNTTRMFLKQINKLEPIEKWIVPAVDIIHDRVTVEIARGCKRMCKFCSASRYYNPVRYRSADKIIEASIKALKSSGYEEISFVSLSSSDHPQIEDMVTTLNEYFKHTIAISLPSLRFDAFTLELADKIGKVRKSNLTFAPEAGTEKLRNFIGKTIKDKQIMETAEIAFKKGYNFLKLYFMIGLPHETDEDIEGLINLIKLLHGMCKKYHKKRATLNISISPFVPKPHTPFEFETFLTLDSYLSKKQKIIKNLKVKGIKLNIGDYEIALLEEVLSRADKNMSKIIKQAFINGANFDTWSNNFNFKAWESAFKKYGFNIYSFPYRKISPVWKSISFV